MATTNKREFWAVQPASGIDSHIFLSEDKAIEMREKWIQAVQQEFSRWENGEPCDSSIVESTIEADGFGGCYQSFTIADHALPGGIFHYEAGTQLPRRWEDCPGFDLVFGSSI